MKCYGHGGNDYNLRAKLEDLLEIEKKRAGKRLGQVDSPMTFNHGSRLLNQAILVVRILGWAWKWAELWVEIGSSWEPLLEEGQNEEVMTKEQLKIVDSTPESRCADARRCRLAALGAALRNRNYDTGEGFDKEALDRALRAVLHTPSLVGPLEPFEIDFYADWLGRAYRSKSRLLGLGDDKIPVDEKFCVHRDDQTPKFVLGDRPIPGKASLRKGKVFEDHVDEPDDFLKPEVSEDGETISFPEKTSKSSLSQSQATSESSVKETERSSSEEEKKGRVPPLRKLVDGKAETTVGPMVNLNPVHKDLKVGGLESFAVRKRRGRPPREQGSDEAVEQQHMPTKSASYTQKVKVEVETAVGSQVAVPKAAIAIAASSPKIKKRKRPEGVQGIEALVTLDGITTQKKRGRGRPPGPKTVSLAVIAAGDYVILNHVNDETTATSIQNENSPSPQVDQEIQSKQVSEASTAIGSSINETGKEENGSLESKKRDLDAQPIVMFCEADDGNTNTGIVTEAPLVSLKPATDTEIAGNHTSYALDSIKISAVEKPKRIVDVDVDEADAEMATCLAPKSSQQEQLQSKAEENQLGTDKPLAATFVESEMRSFEPSENDVPITAQHQDTAAATEAKQGKSYQAAVGTSSNSDMKPLVMEDDLDSISQAQMRKTDVSGRETSAPVLAENAEADLPNEATEAAKVSQPATSAAQDKSLTPKPLQPTNKIQKRKRAVMGLDAHNVTDSTRLRGNVEGGETMSLRRSSSRPSYEEAETSDSEDLLAAVQVLSSSKSADNSRGLRNKRQRRSLSRTKVPEDESVEELDEESYVDESSEEEQHSASKKSVRGRRRSSRLSDLGEDAEDFVLDNGEKRNKVSCSRSIKRQSVSPRAVRSARLPRASKPPETSTLVEADAQGCASQNKRRSLRRTHYVDYGPQIDFSIPPLNSKRSHVQSPVDSDPEDSLPLSALIASARAKESPSLKGEVIDRAGVTKKVSTFEPSNSENMATTGQTISDYNTADPSEVQGVEGQFDDAVSSSQGNSECKSDDLLLKNFSGQEIDARNNVISKIGSQQEEAHGEIDTKNSVVSNNESQKEEADGEIDKKNNVVANIESQKVEVDSEIEAKNTVVSNNESQKEEADGEDELGKVNDKDKEDTKVGTPAHEATLGGVSNEVKCSPKRRARLRGKREAARTLFFRKTKGI